MEQGVSGRLSVYSSLVGGGFSGSVLVEGSFGVMCIFRVMEAITFEGGGTHGSGRKIEKGPWNPRCVRKWRTGGRFCRGASMEIEGRVDSCRYVWSA